MVNACSEAMYLLHKYTTIKVTVTDVNFCVVNQVWKSRCVER